MKKLIIAAAITCAAVVSQAASVGWSGTGAGSFAGDLYNVFVIGQNGVESQAAIIAMLDAGTDVSAYAFGTGNVSDKGMLTTVASKSGKSLDAGTYTSFLVLFDDVTPTKGESKYFVASGAADQTISFTSTAASATFKAGTIAPGTSSSGTGWASYGAAVPEPTSGILLLLGFAGLALRRRRA